MGRWLTPAGVARNCCANACIAGMASSMTSRACASVSSAAYSEAKLLRIKWSACTCSVSNVKS